MELPDPPEGWRLTHLISLGEEWQAHLLSEEATVVATGTTARYAILAAIDKIGTDKERPRFCSFDPKGAARLAASGFDLLQALGLGEPQSKPAPERTRRI